MSDAIKIETVQLPAFLASALVNGDFTSFDDEGEDQALLDRCLEYISPWSVVSCDGGPYFTTIYICGKRFTGNVLDYTLHRPA